jgi:hypothetical protein
MRAGNVWLEASRRYADPQTYLIPREVWPGLPAEVCREIQAPEDGTVRLRERETELSGLLDRVEASLAQGSDIRMEGNDLVVSHLEGEERLASTLALERLIGERLPLVELPVRGRGRAAPLPHAAAAPAYLTPGSINIIIIFSLADTVGELVGPPGEARFSTPKPSLLPNLRAGDRPREFADSIRCYRNPCTGNGVASASLPA